MSKLELVSRSIQDHLDLFQELRQLPSANLLQVQNDLEAVYAWLKEFEHSRHTHRSYQKESLRFLYWLAISRKKPLGSLVKDDIHAYRLFLVNPQPYDLWCAPPSTRRHGRQSSEYKPFSGPLKLKSIQAAMTILGSMIAYFVDAGYLAHNPFKLIKQKLTESFDIEARKIDLQERLLEDFEFAALIQTVHELKARNIRSGIWCTRVKFAILFLAYTGFRAHEFVGSQWCDLVMVNKSWWIKVVGKGKKIAKVPINDECMAILQWYITSMGLGTLADLQYTECPILVKLDKNNQPIHDQGISERALALILKEVAEHVDLVSDNKIVIEKMKKFSPHWLRHFSASMQAKSDIPFEYIKAHHRHSKDETTRLYIHHDEQNRHQKANFLSLSHLLKESFD